MVDTSILQEEPLQNLAGWIPIILLAAMAGWSVAIGKRSKFKVPVPPVWPYSDQPGLALELADSAPFVEAILGQPGTTDGIENRKTAAAIQKLDYPFILTYLAFFITVAWEIGGPTRFWIAAVPALLTAIFDVIEDRRILAVLSNPAAKYPKVYGRAKWLFYFLTLAAEGSLFFAPSPSFSARSLAGFVLGAFLIANGIGGIISSLKGSFNGIRSAVTLSALLLLILGFSPAIAAAQTSFRLIAYHVVLLRVPLLAALILVLLPVLAFATPAKSLLRGLFDVTPLSLFTVTLSAMALAGAVSISTYIVLVDAPLRMKIDSLYLDWVHNPAWWLVIMGALSAPTVITALIFSTQQRKGALQNILSAGMAAAGSLGVAVALQNLDLDKRITVPLWLVEKLGRTGLFDGYFRTVVQPIDHDPLPDHMLAAVAFIVSFVVYVAVGIYGFRKIGKAHTVPALASALMMTMIITWMLSGAAFFFDQWRIPILLIIGIVGTLTAQSTRSDHLYTLRAGAKSPAPNPEDVIRTARNCPIVVCANGGGIQASAWAAQVLEGLDRYIPAFRKQVRMISSVSGGSLGTAYYAYWVANPASANTPTDASTRSSLDEVAWGLAWPDLARGLVPWLFGSFIGRGRALEKAWCLNSGSTDSSNMDLPLSAWNDKTSTGDLPAIILNATIAESGERLLLSTTSLSQNNSLGKARIDSRELHTINEKQWDVGVVTAARLSASFPYVTPAARSDGEGPQPHVVDGGYYDNYGMATLVEWLDQALTGAGSDVRRVMVIQIHGAPDESDAELVNKRYAKSRGWFFQAFAPITTLISVRSAAQVAHNDIELQMLQEKWNSHGVKIETVKFVYPDRDPPLSWHLTPKDIESIRNEWDNSPEVAKSKAAVANFVAECGEAERIARL